MKLLLALLAAVCLSGLLIGFAYGQMFPEASMIVRVLDESRAPMEGARVRVGFETVGNVSGTFGTKYNTVVGLSGADGKFSSSARTTGLVGFTVEKDGYYASQGDDLTFTKAVLGVWQPVNPQKDIVLKKIIHPVPMYARVLDSLKLPAEGQPVGYDLVAADWVPPYGRGTTADFLFKVVRRVVNDGDYAGELELSFSNLGDGIQKGPAERYNQGSVLHSPQVAPLDGYQPVLSLTQGRVPQANGDGSQQYETGTEQDNYLFRVRTVRREDGPILSACYGKIYGQIRFSVMHAKDAPGVQFTYYLNPDTISRSLEFDTDHNLFKLKKMYQPGLP